MIHISLRKSKPRNRCILEPHRTRGEGHKMPALTNLDPRALRSVNTGVEDISLCALSERHTTKRKFVQQICKKDQRF